MPNYFVRMPSTDVRMDVFQALASSRPLSNFESIRTQPDVIIAVLDEDERKRISSAGGIIYEDVQFESFKPNTPDSQNGADGASTVTTRLSLADVVDQIGCPAAWRTTRGRGATIAIVDTGISPGLRELPTGRRSHFDPSTRYHGQHWQDPDGHGSMCAAIAAGSKLGGGRYDGVAPEARVVSARSDLTSRDLTLIFDQLTQARAQGALTGPLVVSNSYGLRCCQSIGTLPEDHPFFTGIEAAVASGIVVCFAAGNNHVDLCNYDPAACHPNTIWGANSHDEVVCVGTVNRALTNRDPATPHVNSSRGPGEYASKTVKPDCVAPTYGEVPWGSTYKTEAWWGTSGACPQVAGLAALILSVAPRLSPNRVGDIIRSTARPLQGGPTCVGHGMIDCDAAVKAAQVA